MAASEERTVKSESLTRREFLRRAGMALSAVAIWPSGGRGSGNKIQRAVDHQESAIGQVGAGQSFGPQSPAAIAGSRPSLLALTPHEHATVAALAAIIVPTDQDPGASETDVAGYIDRLASVSPGKRSEYSEGVAWFDRASAKLFGRGRRLVELAVEEQTKVLQAAEATLEMRLRPVTSIWSRAWRKVQKTYDDLFGLGEGARFFRTVREDTMAGFYTNPISWSMLGYIGPPQPRGYVHYEDCPPQDRR